MHLGGLFFIPTKMNQNTPQLVDSGVSFDENAEGLVIQTYQHIPQAFVDELKQERFDNSQSRVKHEYHRAASIPVVVIDKWMREGFNFYEQPAKAILARLRTENLDYFITSDKV